MAKGMIVVGVVVALLLVGAYYLSYGNGPVKREENPGAAGEPQETYAGERDGEPLRPRDVCQELCRERLDSGADLSDGPCLSNNVAPDWVCDVAHDPRQEVDDNPENQCSAYGETAAHFVEVSPTCKYIREA